MFSLFERLDSRDADDRAVDRVVELIAAQDDVERLIPRHVGQLDVDRALDIGVDDHVEPADVGKRAEHGAQIDAVEIEASGSPVYCLGWSGERGGPWTVAGGAGGCGFAAVPCALA